MADCNELLTSGIEKDCASINAAVGVGRDIILVNYDDFDYAATADAGNRESTGENIDGLTNIELKSGAVQHVFEGTDYSVIPNVTAIMYGKGFKFTAIISISFSIFSVVVGILISYIFDITPAGTIVLLSIGLLAGTMIIKSAGLLSKN